MFICGSGFGFFILGFVCFVFLVSRLFVCCLWLVIVVHLVVFAVYVCFCVGLMIVIIVGVNSVDFHYFY